MSYNPFSLVGKTILVTGASSGIGRATAIECAKMGASVVVTGRNAERLNETYVALQGEGHVQVVADLTDENSIEALVDICPELSGVFLCAGVSDTTPVKFITAQKMARVFDINLISPTITLKMLIGKKRISRGASIVLVSSMGAYNLTPGLGIYAASKRGLNAIMRAFALELVGRKIRVNSIMPSMVKTELISTLGLSEDELALDQANYPLGYGTPVDIANAAIYLLSDASRWVTGSEIQMDGGSTL